MADCISRIHFDNLALRCSQKHWAVPTFRRFCQVR